MAMISSTANDLPEHRKGLIDVCERLGIRPLAMEHLTADSREATQISLAMVDQADIYIIVVAWRYGYVAHGATASITEMEYDRARERLQSGDLVDILVFLMDPKHPIFIDDVDEDRSKVKQFRDRLGRAHVRSSFSSVDELRVHAIQALNQSLARYRQQQQPFKRLPASPRHLSSLPVKPEPFTAHPYSLLQTGRVVGRSEERTHIDRWYRSDTAGSGMLFIVAMGGMGKSALTWRWYSETVEDHDERYDGAVWWSFYESDASYERFVTRCCAYLAGMTVAEVQEADFSEREDRLLSLLREGRFLIVLDGAERLLRAYATLDATYLHDDALDEQTAHAIASGELISRRNVDDFNRRRRLREFTDHRAERLFTEMLYRAQRSRILVSSRLFPSNLENDRAQPLPGCSVLFLRGMSRADAIELWNEFGATGPAAELAQVFDKLGNFPLAVRALAGTVARFRPAPGDFTQWRRSNPDFLSTDASLRRTIRSVLRYALADLSAAEHHTLRVLAAFRMPVDWHVLVDVVWRLPRFARRITELHPVLDLDEAVLIDCLTSLEERGLMGWDRAANRYDLHPVVRLSTWNSTPANYREWIMESVYEHYQKQLADEKRSSGSGKLATQVESFYALGALGRHNEAYNFFERELYEPTLHAESLVRVHLELIEQFFPNGLNEAPAFQDDRRLGRLHNWLTYAYMMVGEPGAAVELTVGTLRPPWLSMARPNWRQLYFAFAECGRLREAEAALALVHVQSGGRTSEAASLTVLPWLAYQLDRRGERRRADRCWAQYRELAGRMRYDRFARSDAIAVRRQFRDRLLSAERLLDSGDVDAATDLLDGIQTEVRDLNRTRDRIRLLELRGRAQRLGGRLEIARRLLEQALQLARSHGVLGLEMPCLIELARVARETKRTADASILLRNVYEPASRGPYPIEEADARVLAAELAWESGDRRTAVGQATAAYVKAWCDGPPYAYMRGLEGAQSVLSLCETAVPLLSAFDGVRFSALPGMSVPDSGDFGISITWPRSIRSGSPDVERNDVGLLRSFIEIGVSTATRTPTPIGLGEDETTTAGHTPSTMWR